MNNLIKPLNNMKSSKVSNYVIAGLDSYLLENGKVRMFKNSRNHQDQITPHSHRFDFTCLVVKGTVTNHLWTECTESEGDFFQSSKITFDGEIGKHTVVADGRNYYKRTDRVFSTGYTYSMLAEELHSITFSKDAIVLFFEEETQCAESYIIEPIVNNFVIPTYKNKEYMFIKG